MAPPRASADLKLSDLVKDGVLHVGDLIAYRRNFSIVGIVVEKDIIVGTFSLMSEVVFTRDEIYRSSPLINKPTL